MVGDWKLRVLKIIPIIFVLMLPQANAEGLNDEKAIEDALAAVSGNVEVVANVEMCNVHVQYNYSKDCGKKSKYSVIRKDISIDLGYVGRLRIDKSEEGTLLVFYAINSRDEDYLDGIEWNTESYTYCNGGTLSAEKSLRPTLSIPKSIKDRSLFNLVEYIDKFCGKKKI